MSLLFLAYAVCALLFPVAVFAQVASKDCPQVFLDTSTSGVYHGLKDIVGEELRGTRRNAGERKMLGTLVVVNPCLVPFILRLTFDNGGAFTMERLGKKRHIRLREPELRYRDRNEVSLTKKFSVAVLKSNKYVYELEFLREDMQGQYKLELWSFVNEQEAKRAAGGVYEETIQFEIEAKKGEVEAKKSEAEAKKGEAEEGGGEGLGKKRARVRR